MATASNAVTIDLVGDNTDAFKALDDLQKRVSDVIRSISDQVRSIPPIVPRYEAPQIPSLGFGGRGGGGGMGGIMGGSVLGVGASAVKSMIGPLVGLAGAYFGVSAAAGFMKSSIAAAAEIETYKVQFGVLLGSAAAAEQRLRELADFAEATPFDLPEVVRASKVLETLTNGALSTGDSLRLVGDAAAATGVSYDDLSVLIGRVYSGIKSGSKTYGMEIARLSELGLISGEARREITALADQGRNTEAWKMMEQSLGRFSGMMEAQSKTWAGAMANLGESWNSTKAMFAAPITTALGPAIAEFADYVTSLRPRFEAAGQAIGNVIGTIFNMFKSGDLAEALGAGIRLGGMIGANYLWRSLQATVTGFMTLFSEGFQNLFKPEYWMGLMEAFGGLGQILIGAMGSVVGFLYTGIMDAFRDPLINLYAGIEVIVEILTRGLNLAGWGLEVALLEAASAFLKVVKPIAGMLGLGSTLDSAQSSVDARKATAHDGVQSNINAPLMGWEAAKAKATEQVDFETDFAREITQKSADALKTGGANLVSGLGTLGGIAADNFSDAGDAFMKSFNATDGVFNESDMERDRKAMQGLLARNKYTPAETPDPAKKDAFGGIDDKEGAGKGSADSLTAIGGGGGVGGADSLLKESERQTQLQEKLVELTGAKGLDSAAGLSGAAGVAAAAAGALPVVGGFNGTLGSANDSGVVAILSEMVPLLSQIAKNTATRSEGGFTLTKV